MSSRNSLEIIQVVQEFSRDGGVETVAFELAKAFTRAGARNSVVAAVVADDGDAPSEIAQITPWLSCVPTRGAMRHIGRLVVMPIFTLAATLALRRRARAARIISHGDCLRGDILVVHAVNAESLALKRKAGNWGWLLNPIHYWVALRDRWMIGGLRYRKYVAVSSRVREELQSHYNVPAERIRIIYNGIDLDRFQATEEARAQIRSEFGIPRDARLLLFVGHEFARKGLAPLIEALALLGERYWLAVVGSDNPARYRKLAEQAESRVVFCGARRDVAAFYAAADAFVLPTAYETFSLVSMEAMAAGLPVFATRVGGIEDYLQDGVNGLTIERNARNIVEKLRSAFEDEAGFATLRAGARATAESFGWDSVATKYLELLKELEAEEPAAAKR